MNSDSNPASDGQASPQPAPHPAGSGKPSMPPVKVTWKTTVAQAKAMAAKLDEQIEAMNAASDASESTLSATSGATSPTHARGHDVAQLAKAWKSAQQEFGEYPPMAYQFIREGVRHTVEMIHGLREQQEREGGTLHSPDSARHVSAQQLCYGIKDLAMDRYGGMAQTVLSHWGIRATRDVGNIVFAMLAVGILGRSDNDALDQFDNVFDFAEELAFPG